MSTTHTRKVQVTVLPAGSVAVAVTVVEPGLNTLPEAGLYVTVAEQLSVTVAAKVATLLHSFWAICRVIVPGQVITGGWLSTTVTVKEQVAVCPLPSVAVAVTVVDPAANTLPETRE